MLARQGSAETDPEKRTEIYFRIQEIYSDESPMVPLFSQPYLHLTTTRVHNFKHPPPGHYDWKTMWMDQG